MNKNDDHLEHYGVKGMKWGVRKKRQASRVEPGRRGKKGKSHTTFQKSPSRLSDVELQKRIRRLELEKKYSELNKPPQTKGKKFAGELMNQNGKKVVGSIVGTTTAFAVNRALKKKFGD